MGRANKRDDGGKKRNSDRNANRNDRYDLLTVRKRGELPVGGGAGSPATHSKHRAWLIVGIVLAAVLVLGIGYLAGRSGEGVVGKAQFGGDVGGVGKKAKESQQAVSESVCKPACEPGYACYKGNCVIAQGKCTGAAPTNALLCNGDGKEVTSDTSRTLVSSCTNDQKCEYVCKPGYVQSGNTNTCVLPSYGCDGPVPQNGVLCQEDDQGLTQDSVRVLRGVGISLCSAPGDTTKKCEYYCPSSGYAVSPDGRDCVSTSTAVCGNNVIDSGEGCDDTNFGSNTCASVTNNDKPYGSLACNADCKGYSFTGCSSTSLVCGNGVKEGSESCDGTDFAGQSCASFGKAYGSLMCSQDCKSFSVSGCTTTPPQCTGGVPAKAQLCSGDNTGLTQNTAVTVVTSCTVSKCEYTCNPGHVKLGNTCVQLVEVCTNNLDDDGDGKIDGVDSDCRNQPCIAGDTSKKWVWSYSYPQNEGAIGPDNIKCCGLEECVFNSQCKAYDQPSSNVVIICGNSNNWLPCTPIPEDNGKVSDGGGYVCKVIGEGNSRWEVKEAAPETPGDVSGDNTVTSEDVTILLYVLLAGEQTACGGSGQQTCDYSGDGLWACDSGQVYFENPPTTCTDLGLAGDLTEDGVVNSDDITVLLYVLLAGEQTDCGDSGQQTCDYGADGLWVCDSGKAYFDDAHTCT